MSRGIQKWSEEAITRLVKQGRGRGKGPTYIPWILTTDLYSDGRTHCIYSDKTGRSHELLSDGELNAFYMLEWARDVTDIREQFPLDRAVTQEIALKLGLHHPCYPKTHVPLVFTLDFLATRVRNGEPQLVCYSVKTMEDLNKHSVVERLEIERASCLAYEMEYHLLVKEQMPIKTISNIKWIRGAALNPDTPKETRQHLEEQMDLMVQDLRYKTPESTLADYCSGFDRRRGNEKGTGIRVVRLLLGQRVLTMDMNNPEPQQAPMSAFRLSALPGKLRGAGGTWA